MDVLLLISRACWNETARLCQFIFKSTGPCAFQFTYTLMISNKTGDVASFLHACSFDTVASSLRAASDQGHEVYVNLIICLPTVKCQCLKSISMYKSICLLRVAPRREHPTLFVYLFFSFISLHSGKMWISFDNFSRQPMVVGVLEWQTQQNYVLFKRRITIERPSQIILFFIACSYSNSDVWKCKIIMTY